MFFGLGAKNADDFEEEFSFSNKNKETSKGDIDKSVKDFTDYMISVSADMPELSEEEINRGVEKILEKAFPNEEAVKPSNNSKVNKVTLRVLFIAALLSVAFFFCTCVVASSHNINIENGFVTFAKDAVKIVFFGNDEAESIDVKTLLEDLEAHGFKDIILPQKLYNYRSSLPVYSTSADDIGANERVTFDLSDNDILYSFRLEKTASDKPVGDYFSNLDNAETVVVDDINIYVFEFENGWSNICFVYGEYDYFIQSDVSLYEMINIAQTIMKMEE